MDNKMTLVKIKFYIENFKSLLKKDISFHFRYALCEGFCFDIFA